MVWPQLISRLTTDNRHDYSEDGNTDMMMTPISFAFLNGLFVITNRLMVAISVC